jgi:hypothetical protein
MVDIEWVVEKRATFRVVYKALPVLDSVLLSFMIQFIHDTRDLCSPLGLLRNLAHRAKEYRLKDFMLKLEAVSVSNHTNSAQSIGTSRKDTLR